MNHNKEKKTQFGLLLSVSSAVASAAAVTAAAAAAITVGVPSSQMFTLAEHRLHQLQLYPAGSSFPFGRDHFFLYNFTQLLSDFHTVLNNC